MGFVALKMGSCYSYRQLSVNFRSIVQGNQSNNVDKKESHKPPKGNL